jgi:hypothetical protein
MMSILPITERMKPIPPTARQDDHSGDRVPNRRSLVVLPRRSGLPNGELKEIANATGLLEYDVRQRLKLGRPAILHRTSGDPGLEAQQTALIRMGHRAVLLEDEAIRRERFPVSVRSVRPGAGAIEFLDHMERTVATLHSPTNLLLVVSNLGYRGDSPGGLGFAGRGDDDVYEEHDRRLARLLSPPLDDVALDVAWDGERRLRIRSGRFNFLSLGERTSPGLAVNLRTLVALLAEQGGRPLMDLGGTLQPPNPGVLAPQLVDGFEYERPNTDRERLHEIYCRYLVALWRAGLWSDVLSVPLPAGRQWHATRAPAESAPSVPPAEPPERKTPVFALPAGAGDDAPQVDPFAALRRWGPPWMLGPLFVVFLGGLTFSNGTRLGSPAALLSAGLLALIHATTLLSRRRLIENVPTARARSVAAGLCEIKGKAEAITPLVTPFSLMPCVYYEYSVMAREESTAGKARRVSLFTVSTGGPKSGSTVKTGNSGHVPFRIVDETGSLEVDPRGATLDVSTAQTLYNPPFEGGLLPPGTPVVVHERYIPVGYPIYILGEFRHLPADNRMVIGRPSSSGLFFLSEKSEKEIVRSLFVRMTVAAVAGVLLTGIGLLQMIEKLGGWK